MQPATINYIGEQPLWGQVGHLFVVLAFVTAVFSVIANIFRTNASMKGLAEMDSWKKTARAFYITHAIAVFGIFVTLLMMVIRHRFEYQYVWQHSKREMPMNYVLACIWEGQEGSTLLWLIWHAVLGLILTKRAKQWEAPVMTFVALVQVFLSMMLLGLYFGHTHIGSNPFELIRMKEENVGLPWTKLPDYLAKIPMFHDGRGLNPLLQNYWMTIHPPTLFLGFALTTIPFAFAMAGLWTKRYTEWQRSALPWAFTGVMILGTGILMGGAWAYESLSFGGFWAWDPVENASFVPWLTLVGAAHVMLLYRRKAQSLFTTFFLCIVTFLLIIYSTFLTKSGILSDTSVHAFTDDGLNEELTIFMGFFLWLSVVFMMKKPVPRIIYTAIAVLVLVFFIHGNHASSMLFMLVSSMAFLYIGYRNLKSEMPHVQEEELWSREFWMFIGSLVLLVASFQIIFYTSSPVINKFLHIESIHSVLQRAADSTGWSWLQKMAEGKIAPDKDVVNFYNKWQICFAFIISGLMAVSQFFKYKNTDMKEFRKRLFLPLLAAAALSIVLSFIIYFNGAWNMVSPKKQYIFTLCAFLLFTTFFSIFANGLYWIKILKGKIKNAGASVAHIGFGILLLGIVISTSKKDTISQNSSRMDVGHLGGSNEANIYLRRGDTLPMGDYMVSYTGHEYKTINGTGYVYFNVDFFDRQGLKTGEKKLNLQPFVQLNPMMGNAFEPATHHYLHKDIYTFVKTVSPSSLNDSLAAKESQSTLYDKPQNHTVAVHDTLVLENCLAVLDSVKEVNGNDSLHSEDDFCIGAYFRLLDEMNKSYPVSTYYFMNKKTGAIRQKDGRNDEMGVKLTFWKVRPESGKIDVYVATQRSKKPDYIVLEASVFPGINILWIGCLVMVGGTFLAVRERIRANKKAD